MPFPAFFAPAFLVDLIAGECSFGEDMVRGEEREDERARLTGEGEEREGKKRG